MCDNFEPRLGSIDMLGRQDHIIVEYPIEDLPQEVFKIERVKNYLLPDG
jgi:hypothetical protein